MKIVGAQWNADNIPQYLKLRCLVVQKTPEMVAVPEIKGIEKRKG
jgi:hypothetical protein